MQGIMHVEVVAMVTQPEQVASNVTNTFHFVFSTALAPGGACKGLKRVLPATADEARTIQPFFAESNPE